MPTTQVTDQRIEAYLSQLQAALRRVPEEDKRDILREIRAHILDSTASAADQDRAVERVLRQLGAPEELAARYTTERMFLRAGRSFSPLLLLRTCWSWAKIGVKGALAFLIALFGYTMALGLTILIFVKPLMPSRVGLWIGPEGFNLGIRSHPEVMHELLGKYFVPVIAVAAFAFAIGTTHLLRWMIRKRSPGRQHGVTEVSLSA
jgi:uncharacterized membrane protein